LRLQRYSKHEIIENAVQEELSRPLKERLLQPLVINFSKMAQKLMPAKSRENLKNKLTLAGSPGGLGPTEFTALRYLLVLFFIACGLLLSFLLGWDFARSGASLGIIGGAAYLFPELFLNLRRRRRGDAIQRALPDILDLLTVSVEAGLGFDAAMAKVVQKMDGPLIDELARVLQEIKMGKPRKEALRDLNKRTQVEDLSSFISSIVQADQLGVSVGGVLRLQAKETRQRRRQKVEEKAMKAPVKMVIPLVFFIFPTVFIVVLSPALLQIYDALMAR